MESSSGVSRRALTRTSVGNEKYEYKDENRVETRAYEPRDQADPAHLLRDSGGVAVRHGTDPNESFRRCQQFFSSAGEIGIFFAILATQTARRPEGSERSVRIKGSTTKSRRTRRKEKDLQFSKSRSLGRDHTDGSRHHRSQALLRVLRAFVVNLWLWIRPETQVRRKDRAG